jgi:hypothetical protein
VRIPEFDAPLFQYDFTMAWEATSKAKAEMLQRSENPPKFQVEVEIVNATALEIFQFFEQQLGAEEAPAAFVEYLTIRIKEISNGLVIVAHNLPTPTTPWDVAPEAATSTPAAPADLSGHSPASLTSLGNLS